MLDSIENYWISMVSEILGKTFALHKERSVFINDLRVLLKERGDEPRTRLFYGENFIFDSFLKNWITRDDFLKKGILSFIEKTMFAELPKNILPFAMLQIHSIGTCDRDAYYIAVLDKALGILKTFKNEQ